MYRACGSSPMETFTFKTSDSYRAYQAIMAARAGAVRTASSLCYFLFFFFLS
jgi:hypothetical protein